MILENLANEKCSHMMSFNGFLDWIKKSLLTKPINNRPNTRIPFLALTQTKDKIHGNSFLESIKVVKDLVVAPVILTF